MIIGDELGAFRQVVQVLESLGIHVHGDRHWRVPCRACKRSRIVPFERFHTMKPLRLLFCKDCLQRMRAPVVTVGQQSEIE